jgi:phosphate:Na+ symporter
MLINAHIAFNASLLVLALPFCGLLRGSFEALLPDQTDTVDVSVLTQLETTLDPASFGTPTQALASLKRELLRMTELVKAMFHPVMDIYSTGVKEQIRAVQALNIKVNGCLTQIRVFVAGLPTKVMTRQSGSAARDMLEYAVRLEDAGDVVTVLAARLHKAQGSFSKEGWQELQAMHETIVAYMKLASNVLISDDVESARLLNIEKTEMKRAEQACLLP